MSNKECSICLTANKDYIKCPSYNCNYITCKECMILLVEFSNKQSILPRCSCNNEFLYTSFENIISKNELDIYKKNVCIKLANLNSEAINIHELNKVIIEKTRKERLDFIEKELYKGVSLTIKLAFLDKLKRIKKSNLKKSDKTQKKCPDISCKIGVLHNNKCIVCNNTFCDKCEQKKLQNHVCDKKDLDSVDFVNSLVKCPQCKYPVLKSNGCDNITCPECKTNFDYITGKVCVYGNHDNVSFKVNKKDSFLDFFDMNYEHYDSIVSINNNIEFITNKITHSLKIIQNLLIELKNKKENECADKVRNKICMEYLKQIKYNLKFQKMKKIIDNIIHEKEIGELTQEKLNNYLELSNLCITS